MPDVDANSVKNKIAIGIIGPADVTEKISVVIKSFPSFHPIVKSYQDEEDAAKLATQLMTEVEVLLFSGPLSYRKVRETVQFHIPVHYIPLTDAALYRVLFRLMPTACRGEGLSVDTLTKQMVERTFKDLGQSRTEVLSYDGPISASHEELVHFHQSQYEQGNCTSAITGVKSVSQALTQLMIPNEWVVPTDQDIVVTLERALLSTETRRTKESQIVVGLINVDEFGKLVQRRSSEHEVQKFKLDIHRLLLDYVESLDGYLTHLGGDEYLFFTTRGIFERETGGYKSIPLARYAHNQFRLSLSIGIGFGKSAGEAGTNARLALRSSKEAGGNTCFIVREDKTLIGPLEMADPIQFDLSLTDSKLLKIAEEAGMTSAYLSRLMASAARFGKIDYKVHELSDVLGISVRSTHRLLLQWIDHDLIDIVGLEKVPKGRPRQIYRLKFIENQTEWVRS